ncbi:tRNA lysidine(34) synthetase TilS [Kamptonema cortianum]|nr:tRNA lysidine(34) synthetase TilS [Kamptonema cortianum]
MSILKKNELLDRSQTVLLGFSGGADSMCLLHLLRQTGISVIAAHLNHAQRPEAESDAEKCATICEQLDVPIIIGRADIPAMARDLKIGIEEAGRKARYSFFNQSAFETSADLIATAHTLDDHVETILFHMARGSGLSGLSGISEKQGILIRPLLPFRRAETQAYCQEHQLPVLTDPGNFNEDFSRVRIRQRLIPEFEAVHPGFFAGMQRLAQTVSEEDQLLDGWAARLIEQCEKHLNGNLAFLTQDVEVCLDTTGWDVHPGALSKRAIRLLARFLGAGLNFEQTAIIHDLILRKEQKSVTAEGGDVVFEVRKGELFARHIQVAEPFRFPITFPGETESEVFGWQITAESWAPDDFRRSPGSLDAVLDQAAIKGGLYLCSSEEALQMTPLHDTAKRPVPQLLKSRSLTAAAKARLPIICDMVGPVWIPGITLADRCKVTETTSRAIRLMLGPLKNAGS